MKPEEGVKRKLSAGQRVGRGSIREKGGEKKLRLKEGRAKWLAKK